MKKIFLILFFTCFNHNTFAIKNLSEQPLTEMSYLIDMPQSHLDETELGFVQRKMDSAIAFFDEKTQSYLEPTQQLESEIGKRKGKLTLKGVVTAIGLGLTGVAVYVFDNSLDGTLILTNNTVFTEALTSGFGIAVGGTMAVIGSKLSLIEIYKLKQTKRKLDSQKSEIPQGKIENLKEWKQALTYVRNSFLKKKDDASSNLNEQSFDNIFKRFSDANAQEISENTFKMKLITLILNDAFSEENFSDEKNVFAAIMNAEEFSKEHLQFLIKK